MTAGMPAPPACCEHHDASDIGTADDCNLPALLAVSFDMVMPLFLFLLRSLLLMLMQMLLFMKVLLHVPLVLVLVLD